MFHHIKCGEESASSSAKNASRFPAALVALGVTTYDDLPLSTNNKSIMDGKVAEYLHRLGLGSFETRLHRV